jgi:hypothetical protein
MAFPFKIVTLQNEGGPEAEFVFLRALEKCNLGHFILADNTFGPRGLLSNKLRHVFGFPAQELQADDYVMLHTTQGNSHKSMTDSGSPVYHYYWGLNQSVWNDNGDTMHLLDVRNGISKTV